MARDEALLQGQRSVLRRTAWRSASVTIGRFQNWELLESQGQLCVPIRRISGGGAIEHGDDLTLAWIAPFPSSTFPVRSPRAIADRVADAVLSALRERSPAIQRRSGECSEAAQQHIVDCFARRSPFDLVRLNENGLLEKIAGFALCRRRDRVLIHASIHRSIGLDPQRDDEVLRAIAKAVNSDSEITDGLDEAEEDCSFQLLSEKYGRAEWNQRIRPQPRR